MSLAGKKFGMLTIVSSPRPDVYKCLCKCGNVIELWYSQLKNNVVRHFGCKDKPRAKAPNSTGTSDLSIGTSTIGGPRNSAAANTIRTQTCSDDATERIGAANFSVRTGAARAFGSVTAGEKPVLDSKTSSPTWDRDPSESHSTGKIPKTITLR